jgi:hypothetical protein
MKRFGISIKAGKSEAIKKLLQTFKKHSCFTFSMRPPVIMYEEFVLKPDDNHLFQAKPGDLELVLHDIRKQQLLVMISPPPTYCGLPNRIIFGGTTTDKMVDLIKKFEKDVAEMGWPYLPKGILQLY